jgi:ubiquitin-conjugating enzyme E2 J1
LLALIGFMPTLGEGAIGSLDYTTDERRLLAKKSLSYQCPTCKIESSSILPVLTEKSQQESAEAKELASQIEFKVRHFVFL